MTSEETIYQVKFEVEDIGSRIKATKKRITWIFAVGDAEHKVTFVWSKQSGKQEVTEGETVFSDSKAGSFYFRKWLSKEGDLRLHVLGTVHTPAKGKVANFRKYELIVNGTPFSRLPNKDGTPLPEKKGQGPHGIYDVIYPHGYEKHFMKAQAPYKSRKQLDTEVKKRMSEQS